MTFSKDRESLDHELSLDLYAVLLRAQAGATEGVVHAIAESRLSLTKLKLLHILERPHERPPRLKQISRLLAVDDSAATRLVRELEQARLVDTIDDEDDRRQRRVVITPKGRDVVDRLDRARVRDLTAFVRTLGARERELLTRAMRALAQRPDIAELRPAD